MIIKDFNLDELDKQEYLHLIQMLMDYYYILFSEELYFKSEVE